VDLSLNEPVEERADTATTRTVHISMDLSMRTNTGQAPRDESPCVRG
jgi:hypothetical protein